MIASALLRAATIVCGFSQSIPPSFRFGYSIPNPADTGTIHCYRGYMPPEFAHQQAWWMSINHPDRSTWPVWCERRKTLFGPEELRA